MTANRSSRHPCLQSCSDHEPLFKLGLQPSSQVSLDFTRAGKYLIYSHDCILSLSCLCCHPVNSGDWRCSCHPPEWQGPLFLLIPIPLPLAHVNFQASPAPEAHTNTSRHFLVPPTRPFREPVLTAPRCPPFPASTRAPPALPCWVSPAEPEQTQADMSKILGRRGDLPHNLYCATLNHSHSHKIELLARCGGACL